MRESRRCEGNVEEAKGRFNSSLLTPHYCYHLYSNVNLVMISILKKMNEINIAIEAFIVFGICNWVI